MQGKLLTFYLGSKLFGTEITRVKEVNRNTDYTPVPGSAGIIMGLVNLRGSIVTLFNMKKILEMNPACGQEGFCLVLKPGPDSSDLAGFMIDRTGDVLDAEEHLCEAAPASLRAYGTSLVNEVLKQRECLIPIIDIGALFQLADSEVGKARGDTAREGDGRG